MSSSRVVWSGYKPFYENALADSKPYNPVELMGYLGFGSPSWIIRGIGAKVSDDNLTGLAVWTAEIQDDGSLGEDKGPMYFGKTEYEASVKLPAGMVAVAWGMKCSGGDASNVVVWGRKWNSQTKSLEGDAVGYGSNGTLDVEMSTPVSDETQQIIVGFGAGVRSGDVNRIAAGYATLGMSPASSTVPVVWGAVDKDGNAVGGNNFSSKRVDDGVYELTWTNAPDILPVVGLTSGRRPDKDDGSDRVLSFDKVTTTGCTVYSVDVGDGKNDLRDEEFSFVAFFPAGDIPGLLFGTVSESGDKLNGSTGWTASRSKTGKYKLQFDPEMDPPPNLIMTSGMRSDESNGSDNIISNDIPSTSGASVYSLDVGKGKTKVQDEVFSFFAWNLNVLPMDPLTHNMKMVARHRLIPGQKLDVVDSRMKKKDAAPSVYYYPESEGTGHWKIKFNFPLPEEPIIYCAPVKSPSGESDGANRIISYKNPSTTSYEVWSTKVGNGKHVGADGGLEITVTMPDQFPV